ncbi:tail fiber domain-containing protein [Dyadobacter sp. LHD-138]|uniref:tail fiber domain-containing protein n=1 Tax=Dyadobacter sp. LHD-138 TaxID=3071413 RepID=UPI0027DFA15F|nr:tail fiber domain-containing protein [Dyadobacter sp. LHD-138]MDQ6482051.1 tail fiber domain-containing protein [Dyadobacter sp. LHD-138]
MLRKITFFAIASLAASTAFAQMKVGASGAPDASAILELSSSNKGLLMPRVALITTTTWGLAGSEPVAGMSVYNTTIGITSSNTNYPANGIGEYFWDGTGWVSKKFSAGNAYVEPWFNVATNTGATTNTQNIYQMGKVGINVTNPELELHVRGSVLVTPESTVAGSLVTTQIVGGGVELYRDPTASVPNVNGYVDFKANRDHDRDARIFFDNTVGPTGGLVLETTTDGTSATLSKRLVILNSNGNVGLGTSTPAQRLHTVGTTRTDGMFEAYSPAGNLGGRLYTTEETGVANGLVVESSRAEGNMIFKTNSGTNTVERMRITNNGGNVGIHTPAPEADLHVSGGLLISNETSVLASPTSVTAVNGSIELYRDATIDAQYNGFIDFKKTKGLDRDARIAYNRSYGTNGAISFETTTDGTSTTRDTRMVIMNSNGNVGIGSTAPVYKLDVTGDINATGEVRNSGVILTSDARLKRNIKTFENGLTTVQKLRPVFYEKKSAVESNDYNRSEIGFLAQDIQKVLPQLVREGKDLNKTLAVDYNSLIPVLTKAIQELSAQVTSLKVENQKLSAAVNRSEHSEKAIAQLADQVIELQKLMALQKPQSENTSSAK